MDGGPLNSCHHLPAPQIPILGIFIPNMGMQSPPLAKQSGLADKIIAAFVYGSIAKKTDSAQSDIDLMLLSDDVNYGDVFLILEVRMTSPFENLSSPSHPHPNNRPSTHRANPKVRPSSPQAPTACNPTGSPTGPVANGRCTHGKPSRLQDRQNNGSPVP